MTYFVKSNDQQKEQAAIAAKLGGRYKLGVVVYKGKRLEYTEKMSNPNLSRYSDHVVVAQGDNLQFEEPRLM